MTSRVLSARLRRIAEPFDDPDWLFELKYEGFRALAFVADGRCRLVSRNGNKFSSFAVLCDELGRAIPTPVVLDGEIVCHERCGGGDVVQDSQQDLQPVDRAR